MLTHKGKIGDVEYEVNPMISYTRGKYVDWEENVRPTSGDDLTDEQIAENILWNARYNRSGKWDDLQWGFQTNGFFTNQAQIDAHPVDIDLAGNQTNGTAATFYDVTATLASVSNLDPLADAINAHAANTGISAVLGATAAEIILTHQTGETIELKALSVAGSTDGTMKLTALDKFGNSNQAKDTTLSRASNSATSHITLGNGATTTSKARGHVLGQMTLNSIKSFTVTGDDTTVEEGLFHTAQSYTGQTTAGGTAQLSAVSGLSVADQEHASDAISVLDAAIARIDQQLSLIHI